MKNAYQRMIEEHAKQIRDVCTPAMVSIEDTVLAAATRAMVSHSLVVDPAQRILADFQESLRPHVKDLWSID